MGSKVKASVLICTLLALSDCQSRFGPSALRNTHPAYNQALLSTLDEQMLLNLVRYRYRDGAYFLEVGSVTVSLSLGGSAGIDTELATGGPTLIKPNAGMTYSDSPTISYTPLQGEQFLKKILSPLPLEAILVMTESGWSMERVLGLTVERVNDLYNAPTASGPTPSTSPKYKEFKRAIVILSQLHKADLIEFGREPKTKTPFIRIKPSKTLAKKIEELRSLLNLSDETNIFQITSNFLDHSPDQLDIRSRSVGSILWYLSHNIEIPDDHKQMGLVTVTRTEDGLKFNWSDTPAGSVFKIRSSAEPPENAFVSVRYRDAWFYIADTDLNTKSTFMMMKQLFNLQAGQVKAVSPTLTIPVGGR